MKIPLVNIIAPGKIVPAGSVSVDRFALFCSI